MIGTIVSLAGAAASGIGSIIANQKRQKAITQEQAKSDSLYNRELYQDPTRRSDNAAYLNQLDKKLKRANEIATNKGKITGATHEQALAQNEIGANAYGDAVSKMGALTSQRRDSLLSRKEAADRGFATDRANLASDRAQAWGNLAGNAASLGGAAISGLDTTNNAAGSQTVDSGVAELGASTEQFKNDSQAAVTDVGAKMYSEGLIDENGYKKLRF